MINSVRNTVLSILNKNNYGYISPADFNLFALQAQLTIFEGYFTGYNNALNKENARRSGTEYANESKSISESIDIFSVTKSLPIVTAGTNVYKQSFMFYRRNACGVYGRSRVCFT